jgi:hypothetical protein
VLGVQRHAKLLSARTHRRQRQDRDDDQQYECRNQRYTCLVTHYFILPEIQSKRLLVGHEVT